MAKPFVKGTIVRVTAGKHEGHTGTVDHSDKSITSVRFKRFDGAVYIDPVWTNILVEYDPTPNSPDLRGRDRDEWRHEAAECQRLK